MHALSLWGPRGWGLTIGSAADAVLGDPQQHHPVAWFGSWASAVESRTYRDSRVAGVVHVVACLAPVLALGAAAERAGRGRPVVAAGTMALATWACVGGRNLADTGVLLADLTETDLPAARGRLGWLCGRLADDLGPDELCRAGIESLAENTADAVVASLFWGAVAGVPGVLAHRGINTLDAMVGHHNERYENFGCLAARLDDLACWVPARLTAVLGALLAPVVGGSVRTTWRVVRRDASNHPSPNGGWCEAAWAGALGVQLGGRNVYPGGRVEVRGLLGDGPRPGADDLRRAARLNRAAQLAATVLFAGVGSMVGKSGSTGGGHGSPVIRGRR